MSLELASPASGAARAGALPPPFACSCTNGGLDAARVYVGGELDIATTPQLTKAFASLEPGYDTLVVDLSRCTFFASSGISILLQQSQRAKEEGFELVVIKAPAEVQRMFDLAGLEDKLTFQDP